MTGRPIGRISPAGSMKALSIALVTVLATLGTTALVGTQPAGAATDSSTLSGEGGTFLQPVMHKLIADSASNLNGLFGSYVANGLDPGIADFVGTAPKSFNADFAVSERPLTAAESAKAIADGRHYAYIPFAATPVAIGTIVTNTTGGGSSINPSTLCPHIQASVDTLGAIFGLDAAQPFNNWSDSRVSCSNGQPLQDEPLGFAGNDDPTMANYALMTLLDSDSTSQGYFAAGLKLYVSQTRAATSSTTPSERLPYVGTYIYPGGDEPFLGKLLTIEPTTNQPTWEIPQINILGLLFPVASVWTGAPLGAAWNIPTMAIENAQGTDVAPSLASATAAEGDATLASTSDPTTNNLVTFTANATDAAAYNNYMMEESYLVVPTNGLPAAKEFALADLIRFILGPAGQQDISSFGAAPATPAMVTAGLSIASALDAQASLTATPVTTTTTSASTSTSSTSSSSSASGSSGSTGASSSSGGSGSGSGLAFTGGPDLVPLVGCGLVLLVGGGLAAAMLRRRMRKARVTS